MIRDYLFIDNRSGEEFFVECETKKEAWRIAYDAFGGSLADLDFIDVYSPEEADLLGYDTY